MVSKPSHPHAGQKCHLPIFFKPLILKGYGAVKKLIMGAELPFGANGSLRNRNVGVRVPLTPTCYLTD